MRTYVEKYAGDVWELQILRADHEQAVLAFELKNRTYFAASVSDRGDVFFENFPDEHRASLEQQDAGGRIFHVLVDEGGAVLGRFNLYDVRHGTAEVGYRVAQELAGRGLATSTVEELCRVAAERYGLQAMSARTKLDNAASRRVLEKAGFVSAGPCVVAGAPGMRYRRDLTA